MADFNIYNLLSEFERGRYKTEEEERLLMKVYSLEYDLVSGLSVIQEENFQKLKGKMFELKELERKELLRFVLGKIGYLENGEKSKKNIDIKY